MVMTRATAVILVILAVLATPVAMASAHCLAGDCEGFCVSAVAPTPMRVTVIMAVVSAASEPLLCILTTPPRPSEPPPRPSRPTV
jgi:hypothetical protein